MPGIPLNGIVQVSLLGRCFGQRIILTHFYRADDASPPSATIVGDLTELLSEIGAGGTAPWTDQYRQCLPQQYTLEEKRAQLIYPTRSVYVQVAVNQNGAHEEPATVANDAAALTLRTDKGGRRQVATKHIGPVPDNVNAQGLIIVAYRTLLTALGTAMMNPLVITTTGQTLIPVIYHRGQLTASDDITSVRVGIQSRVQRRRTVGLGE